MTLNQYCINIVESKNKKNMKAPTTTTTIMAIYNNLSNDKKEVVNSILTEGMSNRGTSGHLVSIAFTVLKEVENVNPENEKIANIISLRNTKEINAFNVVSEPLDWATTFDVVSGRNLNPIQRFIYNIVRPISAYILGIKIPANLSKKEKDELGILVAVAALMHCADKSNKNI